MVAKDCCHDLYLLWLAPAVRCSALFASGLRLSAWRKWPLSSLFKRSRCFYIRDVKDGHPNGSIHLDYIWCVDVTGNGIGKSQDQRGKVRVPARIKAQLKQQIIFVNRFIEAPQRTKLIKYCPGSLYQRFFCTTASGNILVQFMTLKQHMLIMDILLFKLSLFDTVHIMELN